MQYVYRLLGQSGTAENPVLAYITCTAECETGITRMSHHAKPTHQVSSQSVDSFQEQLTLTPNLYEIISDLQPLWIESDGGSDRRTTAEPCVHPKQAFPSAAEQLDKLEPARNNRTQFSHPDVL